MATVGDIGEVALIARLARRVEEARLSPPPGMDALLGIGDDAAAWRLDAPGVETATTDTMVEGVHFRRETSGWSDVGWKSWASNVSDIAAMGCEPQSGLVTLGLPMGLPVEAVDALYDGMLDACACYRTALLGGDIVSSPVVFVTVAMTGRCDGSLLTRSVARAGDAVGVTGPLGASRGGLRLLEAGQAIDSPRRMELAAAHRRPMARPDVAQVLHRHGIRCAMDISDGLIADLGKLASAAGVAARIASGDVPAHPALRAEFGDEAMELAIAGGEDYELLFTGPSASVQAVICELKGGAVIGEIVEGEAGAVEVLDANGARMETGMIGWEHLR